MSTPLRIEAGDLDADEIMGAMHDGRRIVIEMQLFEETKRVTLRYDGEIYYCDTPTRLHRHDDPDEMRACIEKMGYGDE